MSISCGIYSITCTKSKKRYIGSTADIDKRWIEHRVRLHKGNHHSRHLQAAWNKYGEDAFRFEVIAACEPDELVSWEQFYIEAYRSFDRRYGYNVSSTAGSPLGVKHTQETREKVSSAVRERWQSDEYRARLAAAQKEAWSRPGVRAKRSASARQQWADPESRKKRIDAYKVAANRPELLAKRRLAMQERWGGEEDRKLRIEARKKRRKLQQSHNVPKSAARRGEANGLSKLTEENVRDIRERLARGETHVSIAARYGVIKTTISKIKRGLTWKHVK